MESSIMESMESECNRWQRNDAIAMRGPISSSQAIRESRSESPTDKAQVT